MIGIIFTGLCIFAALYFVINGGIDLAGKIVKMVDERPKKEKK